MRRFLFTGIGWILGCGVIAGSAVLGLEVRERVDLGRTSVAGRAPGINSLFASRKAAVEIPEGQYFLRVVDLLQHEYVDPESTRDERKLALGAVRGMVGSLRDPFSRFMNPEQFRAYEAGLKGRFEGVGVEVFLRMAADVRKKIDAGKQIDDVASLIPEVIVSAVAPEGPAYAAGLRRGDRIHSIDGRWILHAKPLARLRAMREEAAKGQLEPDLVRKETLAMEQRIKTAIAPAKARDFLELGESGSVRLEWERENRMSSADVPRRVSKLPPLSTGAQGASLAFVEGADERLEEYLRLAGRKVELDLRSGPFGDFEVMRRCLRIVAPGQDLGWLVSAGRPTVPLGATEPTRAEPRVRLKLRVDALTRGPAEIFALALARAGLATLEGGPTAGDPVVLESKALPGGSGYVLAKAKFVAERPTVAEASR